jgi:MSHA biogenesis protein MshM
MRALQDQLIKSYGEGRQVVVLIDEAHAMPADTLEEIRLLSNLESNHSKLLQLVLFGQPELNDILARPDMRQLKERITHNFGLEPLVRDDIANYLDFRMRAAGYRGPSIFSQAALKLIAQSSLGLTRRINIIADKSLLAAFLRQHAFDRRQGSAGGNTRLRVQRCNISVQARRRETPALARIGPCGHPHCGTGDACLPAGDRTPAPIAPPPTAAATTERAPPAAAASAPATPVAVTPTSTPPDAAVPKLPPPPTSDAALPVNPAQNANAVAGSAPTLARGSSVIDPHKQSPVTSPAMSQAQVPQGKIKIGRLTRDRLESSKAWLDQLPNDRWFIQVFAADATRHAEVESLLRKLPATGDDAEHIRVYYSELSGTPRYGVIYGDFASREAASTAIRSLPKVLRGSKPYPRQAIRLR